MNPEVHKQKKTLKVQTKLVKLDWKSNVVVALIHKMVITSVVIVPTSISLETPLESLIILQTSKSAEPAAWK